MSNIRSRRASKFDALTAMQRKAVRRMPKTSGGASAVPERVPNPAFAALARRAVIGASS